MAGPEDVWQVSEENSDDTCSPRPDCKGLPGHAKGCVLLPVGNGEALKDFRAEECYSHICIFQNAMKAVQDDFSLPRMGSSAGAWPGQHLCAPLAHYLNLGLKVLLSEYLMDFEVMLEIRLASQAVL